jgi:Golgi phosphoprotein 3
MELALRRRIAMVKDSARRRYPLPDRLIEVIDERQTGETILDEALKMIKSSEKMGVGTWIDLLSGTYLSAYAEYEQNLRCHR